MPLPQFMKQISAERNFTTPGTLLRLDPNATAAGATHLLVLGKDEQDNIIMLPGESRSELLAANGDVHCWVLSQEELEDLDPEYDGKIPDKLRLVSVEAQHQYPTTFKYSVGDIVRSTADDLEVTQPDIDYHIISIDQYAEVTLYALSKDPPQPGRMTLEAKNLEEELELVQPSGNSTPPPQVDIGTKFTGKAPDGTPVYAFDSKPPAGPCTVTERVYRGSRDNNRGWLYDISYHDGQNAFHFQLFEDDLIQQIEDSAKAPEITDEDDLVIARKLKAASAPKWAVGDTFKDSSDDEMSIVDVMLTADRGWIYQVAPVVKDNSKPARWVDEDRIFEEIGPQIGRVFSRMPIPKFALGSHVAVNFHGEWVEGDVQHAIRWSQLETAHPDDLLAWLEAEGAEQWIYYVKVPEEMFLQQVPETSMRPAGPQAPEISDEEDLVIAQTEPKKLTYDPENPGQYFYLERPAEQAPPATQVDESKIPEYLYEKNQPVMKNVKPSTPVMQDLRQELDDPDRMLKALAIHIHELEVLRSTITKFSEGINATMDYARRGLEQVQVSGEDELMSLREVAPFKHRDPSGNLMQTPEMRKEWAKARQALTILDKIRSGLETTGLMAVNFRGIVYQLREETELVIRASQHVTDPKVAGFRDWAMTFNEFAVWWDAKRIEQNRQIKNVQGALKSAWKRYRTKHAFFYKRILTRFGKFKKAYREFIKAKKRIAQEERERQPEFTVGEEVYMTGRYGPGKIIEVMKIDRVEPPSFVYKVKHDIGDTWFKENEIAKTEPKFRHFTDLVHEDFGRGRALYCWEWNNGQWYYKFLREGEKEHLDIVPESSLHLEAPDAPEVSGESDLVIAKRKVTAQEFSVGDTVYDQHGRLVTIEELIVDEDGEWEGTYKLSNDVEADDDEITTQSPEYEVGQTGLQISIMPHNEIVIVEREWDGYEWEYSVTSEEDGDNTGVREINIEELEDKPTLDLYVQYYDSYNISDGSVVMGASTGRNAGSIGYWGTEQPYHVMKFEDLPADTAQELEDNPSEVEDMLGYNSGTLVLDFTVEDVVGSRDFEDGAYVQYNQDDMVYKIDHAHAGLDDNGEYGWLYSLEVIDPDDYGEYAGVVTTIVGEDSPTDLEPVTTDYLYPFDMEAFIAPLMVDAPPIGGEEDLVIARRTAQSDAPKFAVGDRVSAVVPHRGRISVPGGTREPSVYESTYVKQIDDWKDSYIYNLHPDPDPEITYGGSAHAEDLTLLERSADAEILSAPRFPTGTQVVIEMPPHDLFHVSEEELDAARQPTLYQVVGVYSRGQGWLYQLSDASLIGKNKGGWQATLTEDELEQNIVIDELEAGTPQIQGEDDIIVAQKDDFDEIEWLSEVETDIEDLTTEMEMMNEFYSQASEQGQQLATTREVYETNHGEVPGDPAVVDVPMAAAARVGEMVNYAVDFEDAVPLKIKTARIIGIDDHNITVVDNEGKTQLVARGFVVTSQGDKIRRKRKRRRKVKPIEQVEETDALDFLSKPTKVPKQKKQQEPKEEKVQLTPMKQQPNQPAAPEGTIPVATPPEQVGAEPIAPMPEEVQQPVAPVMQPVQLIQQTPPPPPTPAPPPVPAPEEMDAVDFTDIPDEEWRTLSNAEKIRMAAVFNRIMIIEYEKISAPEEGVVKSYQVEPYSYRVKRPQRTGGTPVWYLFAHDVIDNHIKAFIVRNIRDVEIIDQSFSPRWDVEFTYNERWERFRKKTTKPGTPPSEVELTEEGFDL